MHAHGRTGSGPCHVREPSVSMACTLQLPVDLDGLESPHSVKVITCCCCRLHHYLKIEGGAPVWDMSCDSIVAGIPSTMAPSTSSRHPPNNPSALVPHSGSKYPCLSGSNALAC